MTTETTPMKDLTPSDGRIEMTNERVLGIVREYLGSPVHEGDNSSGALKRYKLLNSKHFIKFRSFKL
jgi:hypothetical protein